MGTKIGNPPLLPSINLPGAPDIPKVSLDLPKANIPSYKPILAPPSKLIVPPGVKSEEEEENEGKPQPAEVKRVNIPWTDINIPVPQEEILVTAATTAAVSVIATLTVTSMFKHCVKVFKPIFMQLAKRLQKKLNGNKGGEEA